MNSKKCRKDEINLKFYLFKNNRANLGDNLIADLDIFLNTNFLQLTAAL